MICANCDEEYTPPGPDQMIVASGGFCLPPQSVMDNVPNPTEGWCGDCKARWMMIIELGIDPGKNGENLKVPRGGIKFAELS
jgi:hypothetical protein